MFHILRLNVVAIINEEEGPEAWLADLVGALAPNSFNFILIHNPTTQPLSYSPYAPLIIRFFDFKKWRKFLTPARGGESGT